MVVCCIEEESMVEARLACDGLQRLLSRCLHLLPVSHGRLWVAVSAGSGLHCCCGGRVVLFRQCVRQSRGGFLVPGSAVARLGFHPLCWCRSSALLSSLLSPPLLLD
ncbi:hypothetical protein Tsubulata_039730 [Turnera subulata]|uniref:Uncharacterized protein n=1 Tax=Turnera subulata TaxID=218843 RepID=A0A9Q0G3Z6_9ROSI|nr:hypothetical protein Tsubulata_039730 [Turnera subulata]